MKFKLKYKLKSNSQTANHHRDITKKDPEVLLLLQGFPRDFFQKKKQKNVTGIEQDMGK